MLGWRVERKVGKLLFDQIVEDLECQVEDWKTEYLVSIGRSVKVFGQGKIWFLDNMVNFKITLEWFVGWKYWSKPSLKGKKPRWLK